MKTLSKYKSARSGSPPSRYIRTTETANPRIHITVSSCPVEHVAGEYHVEFGADHEQHE